MKKNEYKSEQLILCKSLQDSMCSYVKFNSKCACNNVCVCVCVFGEGERLSLQACSQTSWGCSSSDKRGRDSPSLSVDSGLWEDVGQLCAACDKNSLFPCESNRSRHSCSLNPLIHLFTSRLPLFPLD